MYWVSKSIHNMGRLERRLGLFLVILGPGIITMIADNDAGAYLPMRSRDQSTFQPALGFLRPGAHGVLYTGDDGKARGRHEEGSRRGHLRRLRVFLGVVFHLRPRPDKLVHPRDGIHRHDGRHVHIRRPSPDHLRRRYGHTDHCRHVGAGT